MNRIDLEQVIDTKFLGIIIDEHLDWTEHTQCCNKKYHLHPLLYDLLDVLANSTIC